MVFLRLSRRFCAQLLCHMSNARECNPIQAAVIDSIIAAGIGLHSLACAIHAELLGKMTDVPKKRLLDPKTVSGHVKLSGDSVNLLWSCPQTLSRDSARLQS